MKNVIKPIIRISITIIVSLIIIMFVNGILDIKHSKKNNMDANGWSWVKENTIIHKLLAEKYPDKTDEDYYLLIRNNEEVPKKTTDEKRILVVGDSFVYGYGGDNINYTWWKQLNLKIKEAGYSNVNVYAAAMHGLSTEEELNLILNNDKLIKKVDPDLIIIGYVTNDADQRDESGRSVIKEDWESTKEDQPLYQKNPNLYYELVERVDALGVEDEAKLRELGSLLGFYRWDIKRLMIVEGENLDYYKGILIDVDNRMKELNIPYFYLQSDHSSGGFIDRANEIVYTLMDELNIKIYHDLEPQKIHDSIDPNNQTLLYINPLDAHPNIIWTSHCGVYAYEILKKNYSFIF